MTDLFLIFMFTLVYFLALLSLVDLFIGLVALFFLLLFFYLYIFLNNFFSFFFLTFLVSCVADRVLVLHPGVTPEPLRWESQIQDIGPPETSQLHIISIGESSPRDLCLNTKTQLHPTARKLQGSMHHANQLAKQEHNSSH